MKNSPAVVAALLLFSCFVCNAILSDQAAGQSAVPSTSSGRYQVVVSQPHVGSDCTVVVFEPATGKCWSRSTNRSLNAWEALGSPPN